MKLPIYNQQMNKSGEKELPAQFNEAYRPDLIKRAVHALQSAARQKYGANLGAGMRHSSELSKRRRKYRGCYGFGISRVNRKIHSRRGTRMFWVGATSPQTRGGRRSHPPKAEKNFVKSINKKERRMAICSAIAGTISKDLVVARGHHVPEAFPFLLSNDFEGLAKTQEMKKAFLSLGLADELDRSLIKKVRAGLGKMRGRKYKRKKGPLVVVSGDCPLLKGGKNIPGVDVVSVQSLNAEVLAPGALAGRVTFWTDKAVDVLREKQLFM